jgi:cystathionine beta-lyase
MLRDAVDRVGTDCSKWDGMVEKFGREDILPLWVADSDIAISTTIQEAVIERAKHPIYAYTLYSDSFYQSIIDWYEREFEWSIDRESIAGEHGVVVSINLAIKAFTNEGDGILVQTPIYPPFISSCTRNGRVVLENRLIFENGQTTIDWDDFESKAIDAKLFLLCSPHNPSTRAWSREELVRMAEICQRHEVIVVADEIHSDLVFSGSHTPFGSIDSAIDNTVTLHAPSKTFNIAGLNSSYVIVPNQDLREQYQAEHERAGLDNGNPFGITALQSAYNDESGWLEEFRAHIVSNAEYIREYITTHIPEIVPYKHDATFLMWLDCSGLGLDDEALSSFFIDSAKLGLNSGISFGEAGSGFMRLNLATSLEMLQEAMSRLSSAMEILRNR